MQLILNHIVSVSKWRVSNIKSLHLKCLKVPSTECRAAALKSILFEYLQLLTYCNPQRKYNTAGFSLLLSTNCIGVIIFLLQFPSTSNQSEMYFISNIDPPSFYLKRLNENCFNENCFKYQQCPNINVCWRFHTLWFCDSTKPFNQITKQSV